jgi:hypothetical protein
MKRMMSGAAMLAAVMALAPLHIAAQQGPRGQRGQAAGPRGAGVEMILRQRETLELTEGQVKQLDQIRQEAVQRRNAHQAEMAEMRSRVLAGDLKAEDLRAQAEARRTAADAVRTAQTERVQAVLNEAQRQKIEEWQGQARAFQMGRMSAMRGGRQGMRGGREGMRGQQGFQRGQRGFQRSGARNFRGQDGMRGRRGPGMMGPGMGPDGMGPQGLRGRMDGRRGPGVGPGFGPAGDTIPPA